jgi:hypothetical protein
MLSLLMGQSYPIGSKIWLGETYLLVKHPLLKKQSRLLLIFSAGTEGQQKYL